MTPERWHEVERVCQGAMDLEGASRDSYLLESCGHDEELRREVESLLSFDASAGFVDESALERGAALFIDEPLLPDGTELGPYRIGVLSGAGRMGRVYRARDTL